MSVRRYNGAVAAAELRQLTPDPPVEAVAEIIAAVRAGGDSALLELERRFNPAAATASVAPVPQTQLAKALTSLDPRLRMALETAIENVRAASMTQLDEGSSVALPQGQTVRWQPVAVSSAAAYVPGGRGSYPSTAVMCLVPARAAGVDRLVVVTPLRPEGEIDATVAAVCAMLDVDEVYGFGGAQAVAALAIGTESIDAVDVIVGPGNAYVQEAKRQLFGTIGIDGVAGPSELVVVADGTANPQHIALDLLAQAEHGPDSLVALLSDDSDLLDAVEVFVGEVEAPVALVECESLVAATALADAIAPEHMQIACTAELSRELSQQVRRAGCLFVGHNAATAFGDYVAGSNHVLPTGGAARFTGALSAATFMRRMSIVEIPDEALEDLAEAGSAIADAEGFPAHGRSMSERAADRQATAPQQAAQPRSEDAQDSQ